MPTTYTDLIASVRKETQGSLARRDQAPARGEGADGLVDVREKEENRAGYIPGAISVPRGFLEIQVEQQVPDKNAPIVALLRRRHPLGARRRDARRARLHPRRDGEPRLRPLEGPRLPDGDAAAAHRRAARPLLAAHPAPRGGRGGAGQAPEEQGAPSRRRRARLARRRSTSPRPASGRSGSSTPTWSMRRTCSARSSTRRAASGCRRSRARRRRSPISTPT